MIAKGHAATQRTGQLQGMEKRGLVRFIPLHMEAMVLPVFLCHNDLGKHPFQICHN